MNYKTRTYTDRQKVKIKELSPAMRLARRVAEESKLNEVWLTRILPRLREKYKCYGDDDYKITIDCGNKQFEYDYKRRKISRVIAGKIIEKEMSISQLIYRFLTLDA